ncbi:hypothetical protein Sango_1846400 [Sesamum angolense]|uniref:Uncharacterized protein n=1 Tax=Sesamum angolense TaxID=2727404 RepID=A0AAE2BQ76_9LAMI|nr:hypothetical protein Sango_1846400 [Sesamum angolense]
MSFEEMCPVFRKVIAEWSPPRPLTKPPAPFLFHVHGDGNGHSGIRIIATDFQSNTFQAIKSRHQLEDLFEIGSVESSRKPKVESRLSQAGQLDYLGPEGIIIWLLDPVGDITQNTEEYARDDIGIGGSWSEFVDYVTTSLKSGDVKLVMEDLYESGGASHAKLIAQKAKECHDSLFHLDATDFISKVMTSIRLNSTVESENTPAEQESKYQLTKVVAAEQEKNVTLQKQLDMLLYSRKHKLQKISDRDNSDSTSVMVSQDSPDKHAYNPSSTKGANRVVPAYRRSKVRGAVLDDTEDDA